MGCVHCVNVAVEFPNCLLGETRRKSLPDGLGIREFDARIGSVHGARSHCQLPGCVSFHVGHDPSASFGNAFVKACFTAVST
jgi:hypothetical protein